MISNCCVLSCYNCDKINSVGLNKKFFHIFGLESGVGGGGGGGGGGGQDTPARVS